jgi:hypothetical protein
MNVDEDGNFDYLNSSNLSGRKPATPRRLNASRNEQDASIISIDHEYLGRVD